MNRNESNQAELNRCWWCGDDPLYRDYHDTQWGRPVASDQELFEKLCLDGQQAGLSWITILKKQETYRRAYDDFDAHKIVTYDDHKRQLLMNDAGIVRNKLKIESIIKNARGYLDIQESGMSFAAFLWDFVDGEPIQNQWERKGDVPVNTPVSDAMSKALKKRGFNFVGSTICYAFMQAVGMVNDHLTSCFCHEDCAKEAKRFQLPS